MLRLLLCHLAISQEQNRSGLSDLVRCSIDVEAFGQRSREASRRGRQLGDEEFVENLERRCGRRLRARPVRRPKKVSAEEVDQLSFGYGV